MPQAKVCGSMNAVPSPGHKKSEKFKLNQEIAKFLSFKKASPPVENSRKIRRNACKNFPKSQCSLKKFRVFNILWKNHS